MLAVLGVFHTKQRVMLNIRPISNKSPFLIVISSFILKQLLLMLGKKENKKTKQKSISQCTQFQYQ